MCVPVIARNLLESIRLLASVSPRVRRQVRRTASRRTSSGASDTPSRRRRSAPRSTRYIGYEAAARGREAGAKEGRTIRDIVVDEGLVSEAEADKALDVMAMTKGGVAK